MEVNILIWKLYANAFHVRNIVMGIPAPTKGVGLLLGYFGKLLFLWLGVYAIRYCVPIFWIFLQQISFSKMYQSFAHTNR